MAVINSCPGLEVKVVSNESALPEYADSQATDPHNTITTYVEVNSDGAFQVHFQFTDGYSCRYGVRVELRLDGHKVDSCLYRRSQLKKEHRSHFRRRSIEDRRQMARVQLPVLAVRSR